MDKDARRQEAISEDAGLVARVCCGDLGAFGSLYQKYKGRLYRTALAITGDKGAAEEVLQDAFVRAYAAMEKVEGCASVSPWLHRIVVNLSCNWSRRNREWSLPLDTWLDRLVVPARLPERTAETIELGEIIREALAKLGFNQRVVIALYYVQGFSMSEIAYILDCPTGTVKSRLHYACQALRKRLKEDKRFAGEVVYETT